MKFQKVTDDYSRFIAKVQKDDTGCWIWQASKTNGGYGKFSITRTVKRFAHRWSYEHFVGPIPEGLVIDHLCRNPSCVNPEHLEPVTIKINTLRGTSFSAQKSKQTHCIRGHAFDEANTHYRPSGFRKCRACQGPLAKKYYEKKKQLSKVS